MRIAASPQSEDDVATSAPRRHQRPRNANSVRGRAAGRIYIGRPMLWANPFLSERFGHARAVGLHRAWLAGRLTPRRLMQLGFNLSEIDALYRLRRRVMRRIHELAGRDLECWCAEQARYCHGDTLIERANPGEWRVAA